MGFFSPKKRKPVKTEVEKPKPKDKEIVKPPTAMNTPVVDKGIPSTPVLDDSLFTRNSKVILNINDLIVLVRHLERRIIELELKLKQASGRIGL